MVVSVPSDTRQAVEGEVLSPSTANYFLVIVKIMHIPMDESISSRLRQLSKRLNQYEQYYQMEVLDSMPVSVQVTTGGKCNLKCEFCTEREGKAGQYYQNLSLEIFQGYFAETLYLASEVQLYGWGEPFVNPDYEKIFDFVAANFPGIMLQISTNGTLLNDKWVDRLISYSPCSLNVSLNAASPETYASLMKRDLFDQVIENIRRLRDVKRKSGRRNPSLTLSFVANTKNIDEFPAFIDLAAELDVDYVTVQDMIITRESNREISLMNEPARSRAAFVLASQKAREKQVFINSFIPYSVDYFMDVGLAEKGEVYDTSSYSVDCSESVMTSARNPYASGTECFEPWERFMVAEDGSVGLCCRSKENMGNLFEQNLQEIWNGEMYRYYRRTINTHTPPPECAVCPKKTGYG